MNWKRDILHFSVPLTDHFLLKVIMYIRTSIRKTDQKQKKSVFAATAIAIVFFFLCVVVVQHSFHAKQLLLLVSLIEVPRRLWMSIEEKNQIGLIT